jgi:hypothetical protein
MEIGNMYGTVPRWMEQAVQDERETGGDYRLYGNGTDECGGLKSDYAGKSINR